MCDQPRPQASHIFNVHETEGSLGHTIVQLKLPHRIVMIAVMYNCMGLHGL